jgi:hypothetical protein
VVVALFLQRPRLLLAAHLSHLRWQAHLQGLAHHCLMEVQLLVLQERLLLVVLRLELLAIQLAPVDPEPQALVPQTHLAALVLRVVHLT